MFESWMERCMKEPTDSVWLEREEWVWSQMKKNEFKLAIGIPLNYPMVYAQFLDSFIALEKPSFLAIRAVAGNIATMREQIVEDALAKGCTHLVQIDTDMVYHPKTIIHLLWHTMAGGKDVVGALCHRRYPPFDPLVVRGEINSYYTFKEWKPGELVEVDATGTGCLMTRMSVFNRLERPWFWERPNPDPHIIGTVGEDFGFCHDLRKAGIKIYVDTSVPAAHLATMQINGDTHFLFTKLVEAKEVAEKKKKEESAINKS